jgi:hypothetical protein
MPALRPGSALTRPLAAFAFLVAAAGAALATPLPAAEPATLREDDARPAVENVGSWGYGYSYGHGYNQRPVQRHYYYYHQPRRHHYYNHHPRHHWNHGWHGHRPHHWQGYGWRNHGWQGHGGHGWYRGY